MPRYQFGDQVVRRKNLYLPCVINARLDDMTDDEQAVVYKAAYWADNIASSEWPAVLGDDDCSPSAKSRLKKKAAGWLMALARIAYLHPEMFAEIAARADEMYCDQIDDTSLELQTLRNLAARTVAARRLVTTTEALVFVCSHAWIKLEDDDGGEGEDEP